MSVELNSFTRPAQLTAALLEKESIKNNDTQFR